MSIHPLLEEFKELKLKEAMNFELMNEIFISHHSTAIEPRIQEAPAILNVYKTHERTTK